MQENEQLHQFVCFRMFSMLRPQIFGRFQLPSVYYFFLLWTSSTSILYKICFTVTHFRRNFKHQKRRFFVGTGTQDQLCYNFFIFWALHCIDNWYTTVSLDFLVYNIKLYSVESAFLFAKFYPVIISVTVALIFILMKDAAFHRVSFEHLRLKRGGFYNAP